MDLCSHDVLVRLRLRRATRRLRERADDRAARKIDLEGIVLEALGVAQQRVSRTLEGLGTRRLPAQRCFGSRVAPGLVRDTAKRKTRLLDAVALELQPDGDGHERECIGQA